MWRTKEKERPLRCRLHVMRFANSSVTRRQHTQEETERAAWTSTQHGFRSFHILPIRCFPLQQASTTRCPTEATSPVLGVAVADGVVAASRSYLSESDGQMNSDAVVVSRRACPRENPWDENLCSGVVPGEIVPRENFRRCCVSVGASFSSFVMVWKAKALGVVGIRSKPRLPKLRHP